MTQVQNVVSRESKVRVQEIPKGNQVWLCDCPEGCNKIPDRFKNSESVVGKHSEPNVYDIKPVNGKIPVCTVNQQQFLDLKITQEEERSKDPDTSKNGLQVPIFNPKARLFDTSLIKHQYATAQKEDSSAFPKYHSQCGKWRTMSSTNIVSHLLFQMFWQTLLDLIY